MPTLPPARPWSTGAELARLAQEIATAPTIGVPVQESARNRLTGLVTRVIKDEVMAQVDLQCGPFRVVSLMSAEAATELKLETGRAGRRLGEVHQCRHRGSGGPMKSSVSVPIQRRQAGFGRSVCSPS